MISRIFDLRGSEVDVLEALFELLGLLLGLELLGLGGGGLGPLHAAG